MNQATIWRFWEAPEEYKILSEFGGDEDWVIFIPTESSYDFNDLVWKLTVCDSDEFIVKHGTVHITCHA